MILKIKYLVMIFILGNSFSASAQSTNSTDFKTGVIEVFGDKITMNKFDAPIKIQTITEKEINNKNGETLSDILQLGGNIFIKSYGGPNSLNTISMNGLGSEQTLILLNGFMMNSYQNSQIDLNTVGKDNIERVEILNNGLSSVYGSEAIGGVVNIVTKKNLVDDIGLNLNGQFGSYDERKVYAGFSKSFKEFNINLNYSKENAINNYDYYYNNGVEKLLKERANSNYEFSNYSIDVNYFKEGNLKLSLYSNYSNQFRNIPGIEAGSEPSHSNQLDRNWNNIISYEKFLSGNLTFKSQINFQNNLSNYSDKIITDSYYKNIVLSNSSQVNITKNNIQLASGYEITYAALKSDETKDNARRIQPGLFIVSEINMSGALKLFPSIRYDYISDISQNVVSGKLGINIKPLKDYSLNFKASAGNNFAAPTFNELYWKGLGNRELKPESSVNADAGAIIKFNMYSVNTIEVTYTYIDITNKIVWSPDAANQWTPKNIGKSTSNVILLDADINKEFSKDMSVKFDFNYSFTQSLKKSSDYENDPSYDKQIFYVPEQMAKCNLAFNYKKSGLNLFYTFTGKRYTNFENTNYLPAIDLFEGNVYRDFVIDNVNAQIKFEVNNIFNADYQVIAGYPTPLRNYKLDLKLEY